MRTEGQKIEMVVYLDVLLAVNLVMDYVTLSAAAGLAGVYVKRTRLLLAAVAGGAYAVFAVKLQWLALFPFRVIFGLAVCFIAFYGKKPLSRLCLLYFLVAAGFAGLATALGAATGRRLLLGAGYYMAVPMKVLLLAMAVSYAVSGISLRGDALHGPIRREVETLSIRFFEREAAVRVLHDTGNTLSEPVSGKPAIVINRECAERLLGEYAVALRGVSPGNTAGGLVRLPRDAAKRFGLLPFSAVGTGEGLLLYFRPDRVTKADGKTFDCVIAVSPDKVGQGRYDGLVGV